jgi:hypothetical protein
MMRAVRKIQAITRAVRAVPRREVVHVLVHLVPRRDWRPWFRAISSNIFTRGIHFSLTFSLSSSLTRRLWRLRGISPQNRSGQPDLAFLGFSDGFLNSRPTLNIMIL